MAVLSKTAVRWAEHDRRMITALLVTLAAAQAATFDASRWTLTDPGARMLPYLGRPSLFLDSGVALLNGSSFGDGTIDVDVALHGHPSFAGIAFRAASDKDYELVYVRPHLSRRPDALQYTPVYHGSAAWQLYTGDGFTAAAELPLNRWVHLKLVASGNQARLYVDGAATPQLTMTDLKRPWAHGQVGLWGGLGGASFSNFTVSPADTTAPPSTDGATGTSGATADGHQLLKTWDLSQAFETAKVPDNAIPGRASLTWTPVVAERSGIVNIAQYRASVRSADSVKGSRDLAFARAVVTSSRAQRMRLVLAYSDAVHLFVNGRLLFEGESAFQSRDTSFLGIASLGPDAIYVDLRPGDNEIVLAVSETFGGWGFAVRLEPVAPE